eukprot:gnl/Spiro4/10455_TR5596_c0_g1_i1.p1 gnl/Spiro4/10455_TR5596_c0_g1~~gnl/Spiro4/10455_TR5596_c0_g1_i1.p1  ORF type:complete len:534 (-),score=113.88 gnl/Spiro4/10455_TR5596_c0_g1_i1:24-1580(-)
MKPEVDLLEQESSNFVLCLWFSLLAVVRNVVSFFVRSVCFVFGWFQRVPPLRSLTQIVDSHGYVASTFQVPTLDGYILNVFRIYSKSTPVPPAGRPVALLMHGLVDCAYTWVCNGPKNSLAYALCDAGYDVWLGNNRGNRYATKHSYLSPSDNEFWQFSWDEFARYDLPATTEFVLKYTGQNRLSYVGHSEGTTQMFARLSDHPEFANNLSCFVALGPVATIKNLTSPLLSAAAKFHVDRMVSFFYRKGFVRAPRGVTDAVIALMLSFCPGIFVRVVNYLCGSSDSDHPTGTECAEFVQHEPGGTSVMNVVHWAQTIRCGRFQMHDYGTAGNKLRYGQPTAPMYDLARIPQSLPIQFYYGGRDEIATVEDVQNLLNTLELNRIDSKYLPTFNHTDFLWCDDAPVAVVAPTIQFLNSIVKPLAPSHLESHALDFASDVDVVSITESLASRTHSPLNSPGFAVMPSHSVVAPTPTQLVFAPAPTASDSSSSTTTSSSNSSNTHTKNKKRSKLAAPSTVGL